MTTHSKLFSVTIDEIDASCNMLWTSVAFSPTNVMQHTVCGSGLMHVMSGSHDLTLSTADQLQSLGGKGDPARLYVSKSL